MKSLYDLSGWLNSRGLSAEALCVDSLIKISTGFYTVVSGDVLGSIAEKFDVSIEELKAKNGLKNSNINIGQRLVIPPSKNSFLHMFVSIWIFFWRRTLNHIFSRGPVRVLRAREN